MKLLKIIIASIVVTVFNAAVGMLCCGGVFNWVYKLEPTNVWKPMEGAPSPIFFVGSLVVSLIFVLVYVILKKGIPGKSSIVKGLMYGLCIWAVGMLPGMFATYSFMTVHQTVILYWTVLGLVQTPIQGAIAALIVGK